MRRVLALWILFSGTWLTAGQAGELTLSSPLDYQVVQRTTRTGGPVRIAGQLPATLPATAIFEARWSLADPKADKAEDWQPLAVSREELSFESSLPGHAGAWHSLRVRVRNGDSTIAEATVPHVGIGEVFVIAGQSNSANHGEARQSPQSGRVAAFDGTRWQIANDPQPGASGGGGSFIPAFGDALVAQLDVPVGIVACGIGATSVREWLPKGTAFPHPPTIEGRVEKQPSGEWVSRGEAYEKFLRRMQPLGPRGYRAVLWHQGESDANQRDPTRTLPGTLYRQYLEQLIRESRRDIGWEAPWFVAQVSYHVPGDEASPEIREAQASLWKDQIAHEGPDSDALKGELRERKGQGVHFSATGLREHGTQWATKVAPWVQSQVNATPRK